MMAEKEFDLKEKREIIRKYLIDIGASLEEARKVWNLITNQDKEFIKRENDLIALFIDGQMSIAEFKKRRIELIGEDLKDG